MNVNNLTVRQALPYKCGKPYLTVRQALPYKERSDAQGRGPTGPGPSIKAPNGRRVREEGANGARRVLTVLERRRRLGADEYLPCWRGGARMRADEYLLCWRGGRQRRPTSTCCAGEEAANGGRRVLAVLERRRRKAPTSTCCVGEEERHRRSDEYAQPPRRGGEHERRGWGPRRPKAGPASWRGHGTGPAPAGPFPCIGPAGPRGAGRRAGNDPFH